MKLTPTQIEKIEKIKQIHDKHTELCFTLAIESIFGLGKNFFTKEMVESLYEDLDKEKEDKTRSLFSIEYQREILDIEMEIIKEEIGILDLMRYNRKYKIF